jgi:hypothetical protein
MEGKGQRSGEVADWFYRVLWVRLPAKAVLQQAGVIDGGAFWLRALVGGVDEVVITLDTFPTYMNGNLGSGLPDHRWWGGSVFGDGTGQRDFWFVEVSDDGRQLEHSPHARSDG